VALVGFFGFSMLDHPANTDRVALAFWIVAGFAAAVADPGGGLVARLRGRGRRGGGGPVDLEHRPSLADRERTGNVRPLPPHPTGEEQAP
jgi:hypothetical protein